MVANILPADPHPPHSRPLGWGKNVKIQLVQNIVMLHIKLKEMEHIAPCKHILSPKLTINLWVGLKGKKSGCGHVAYQIKGKYV